MENLPLEVLEKILSYSSLSIWDVINFSSTCKIFRELALNSMHIWKHKFLDNFPKFNNQQKFINNFYEEILYIYGLKRRTFQLLETMSEKYYKTAQLPNANREEWLNLIMEQELTYLYVTTYLYDIINTHVSIKSIEVVPLNTPGNKTIQYYAAIALRYIKQNLLSHKWTNYTTLPAEKQTLEFGASFIAQWFQTELDFNEEDIGRQFDDIATIIKEHLAVTNPNHQIFKTAKETLDEWKTTNLTRSQWDVKECRQIIIAIQEIMYGKIGFHGNHSNYYHILNSLINKVLETKTGLPILLAIVYESVARRLGLFIEPINFPAHFLLRYCETDSNGKAVYYIDTFNSGDILRNSTCPYSSPRQNLFPIATALEVVERMANNIEMSASQQSKDSTSFFMSRILDLLVLLHPNNTTILEHLNSADENISAFDYDCQLDLEVSRERRSKLKYAVGMIMVDVMANCQCVIYGWTSSSFSIGGPIYRVLNEHGVKRTVAEEYMKPSVNPGNLLTNSDIGRYFSHFFENHFVPNARIDRMYPADGKVRHKFYQEMLLNNYKPI